MKRLLTLFLVLFVSNQLLADEWFQRADITNFGRHRCAGFAIGNKAYAGIGHMNGTGVNIVYQDWWEFDPASNSWTQKANYPIANYGVAAFGTSTHGYIGGGTFLANEFYEYDPITNTWTAIPNCPSAPNDQTAFSVQDKGYVVDNSNFYEYDPVTQIWTVKTSPPVIPGAWCSSFSNETSGFVKFGVSVLEYKPSLDQWIARATFPGYARGGSSMFCIDDYGYVISGYGTFLSDLTKEVWRFHIPTNTWEQMEDFDGSSRRFSVGMNVNNRGYFGFGTNGINFQDWWVYDNFTPDPSLGIDQNNSTEISIFPNPSSDFIEITYNQTAIDLEIINSEGKTVELKSQIQPNEKISIEHLLAGNYILLIRQDGRTIAKKNLIKN